MIIYIYIYIYIYIKHLFVDEAFLINYVDGTALYSGQKRTILNQSILKKNFMYLQKWFHENVVMLCS